MASSITLTIHLDSNSSLRDAACCIGDVMVQYTDEIGDTAYAAFNKALMRLHAEISLLEKTATDAAKPVRKARQCRCGGRLVWYEGGSSRSRCSDCNTVVELL